MYGARPLRRAITKLLEDRLAMACLDNPIQPGTHINITQQIKPYTTTYSTVFEDLYTTEILI